MQRLQPGAGHEHHHLRDQDGERGDAGGEDRERHRTLGQLGFAAVGADGCEAGGGDGANEAFPHLCHGSQPRQTDHPRRGADGGGHAAAVGHGGPGPGLVPGRREEPRGCRARSSRALRRRPRPAGRRLHGGQFGPAASAQLRPGEPAGRGLHRPARGRARPLPRARQAARGAERRPAGARGAGRDGGAAGLRHRRAHLPERRGLRGQLAARPQRVPPHGQLGAAGVGAAGAAARAEGGQLHLPAEVRGRPVLYVRHPRRDHRRGFPAGLACLGPEPGPDLAEGAGDSGGAAARRVGRRVGARLDRLNVRPAALRADERLRRRGLLAPVHLLRILQEAVRGPVVDRPNDHRRDRGHHALLPCPRFRMGPPRQDLREDPGLRRRPHPSRRCGEAAGGSGERRQAGCPQEGHETDARGHGPKPRRFGARGHRPHGGQQAGAGAAVAALRPGDVRPPDPGHDQIRLHGRLLLQSSHGRRRRLALAAGRRAHGVAAGVGEGAGDDRAAGVPRAAVWAEDRRALQAAVRLVLQVSGVLADGHGRQGSPRPVPGLAGSHRELAMVGARPPERRGDLRGLGLLGFQV
mmetsp:Transcript_64841/g.183996  ORF Transcript_64841/g.183996 Transcript_64841/m.183996 type:complete len:580 (-) Transcript_64841:1003-2742(-)